jgi:flagellar biosynthesis protein FliQ|tara:strand:+ start:947 stop:1270 length:324 start_codon:yes stop_codon:yes gene_type:complete
MTKETFTMSEIAIMKLIYATVALCAGLTVGVVVAVFVSIMKLIETLISFPLVIYKTLMESYKAKILMQAFAPNTPDPEVDTRSKEEKMWDRHIARIRKKEPNKTDET